MKPMIQLKGGTRKQVSSVKAAVTVAATLKSTVGRFILRTVCRGQPSDRMQILWQ